MAFLVEAADAIRAMYLLRYARIDPSSEYRANVFKVHRAQKRDVQRASVFLDLDFSA